MTYDERDESAAHDQDDDRDPGTAVSVTRTDIPKQTEFRLVSPAPQTPPSEDGPPGVIPAQALPVEPGRAAPDDGQPAEPEGDQQAEPGDQPAIPRPHPV